MSAAPPLRVAVPWTLSRYIPMNGIHPLGEPWFEPDARVRFHGVDLPGLARALERSNRFAAECARRAQALARDWIEAEPDLELLAGFIGHVTPEELWATSDLPGELEFHHTCPMTAGRRPFVFYCESFLPILFPYLRHGEGVPEEHAEVKRLFHSILGSPRCIGILCHLPETLEEIRAWFRDPAIDAKLVLTRVGMLERNLRRLLGARRERAGARDEGPVFLFTNSAHQSPQSVPLRGGIAVLRFAERWLREGRPGRFVFRTARPDDAALRSWGVDGGYLRAQEPGRVQWLESFLEADAQLDLFAQADFLLLPSAGLHSLTLMQAMAAGAVPVVSDTIGPETFVEDGRTGIVLRGVRDAIWERHEASGILCDRYDRFPALGASLADQLHDRLRPLVADPAATAQMRGRAQAVARERFSGDAYRDSVLEGILRCWHERGRALAVPPAPSLLESAGAVRSEGWQALFALPPIPRQRPVVPGELCFAGGSAFFRVRGRTLGQLDAWSPFVLKRHGLLGRRGTRVYASAEELAADTARPAWRQWLDEAKQRLF